MRTALMAIGTMIGLAASSHARDANPSPVASRSVQFVAFQHLEVAGPIQASVLVGPGPARVVLSGPPMLLADTLATIEGDTLIVRFRDGARWSWNPGSGVTATVFAPNLTSVRTKGAALIDVDRIRGLTFAAATDGSGAIALHGLDLGRVQLSTAGSGGITAEGRARDVMYAVGGAGSIDAKRLRVENAAITVGGAGSVFADVSHAADVAVSGSGHVDVVGGGTCADRSKRPTQIECR